MSDYAETVLIAIFGVVVYITGMYCWINEKKIMAKIEERKRKKSEAEIQKLLDEANRIVEALEELGIEDEQEQKAHDREKFERLAKEHPDWL